MGGSKGAQVLHKEGRDSASFNWISLKRITWRDDKGRVRQWEVAERTTKSRGTADAVAVFAKVRARGRPPLIPVVVQYRPPIASYCVELPAGLIDAGETVAQAAVRELREETGLSGTVVEQGVSSANEPGLLNSSMVYAIVEVDAGAPENQRPEQRRRRKDRELIRVHYLPWDDLANNLLALRRQHGYHIDSRLLTYAVGLEHGKSMAARLDDHTSTSTSTSTSRSTVAAGRASIAPPQEPPLPAALLRARL